MLKILGPRDKRSQFCDGISRRNFLQIGGMGAAGLTLPQPNTELALLGGFDVELPDRQLVIDQFQQLSSPGWFAAGNILGGFHGAQWCFFNGRRLARRVAQYLENN